MKPLSRRRFLSLSMTTLISASAAGCGTILYPERRGQPAGQLDWKVVGLDALGLVLFFVPGVIAFAVDFHNGSIYLPEHEYGRYGKKKEKSGLKEYTLPAGQRSEDEIAKLVSRKTGTPIKLVKGEYRTRSMNTIEEFWPTTDEMTLSSNHQS